jgi:hypothetical protein
MCGLSLNQKRSLLREYTACGPLKPLKKYGEYVENDAILHTHLNCIICQNIRFWYLLTHPHVCFLTAMT